MVIPRLSEDEELENFLYWVMLAAGHLKREEFAAVGAPAVVWQRYLDIVEVIRARQRESQGGGRGEAQGGASGGHVPAPPSATGESLPAGVFPASPAPREGVFPPRVETRVETRVVGEAPLPAASPAASGGAPRPVASRGLG